jgi:hypothetical protein
VHIEGQNATLILKAKVQRDDIGLVLLRQPQAQNLTAPEESPQGCLCPGRGSLIPRF